MDSTRRSALKMLLGLALERSARSVSGGLLDRSIAALATDEGGVPAWVPANSPPLFFDHYGLIVQRDGNGGDTAQREGFGWFGWSLLKRAGIDPGLDLGLPWEKALGLLEIDSTGEFRRHPDPGPDGKLNRPDDFSRDQQTAIVAAL